MFISYVQNVAQQIVIKQWVGFLIIFVVLVLTHRKVGRFIGRSNGIGVKTHQVSMIGRDAVIAFILWSTLFIRTPGAAHQANLIPLWSWYQGFLMGNDEIRWQIYFNILLFIPFGISLYLSKARPLWQILLRGFLLSLFIESCQVIFCLGLFEWDDLIHNSLGCVLGGYCGKVWENVWRLHRLHK